MSSLQILAGTVAACTASSFSAQSTDLGVPGGDELLPATFPGVQHA